MRRVLAALPSLICVPALMLAACAGPAPSKPRVLTVDGHQRTRVQLVQLGGGPVLTLQNESVGSRSEVYSDDLGDPTAKVLEDAALQALVDVLTDQDFFERAAGAAAPGARELVVIEHGDRRWVLSRPLPRSADDPAFQAFQQCRGYVLALYNQTMAYHSGRGLDAEALKRQQDALRRQADDARARLDAGKGQDQRDPRK